ncbi:Fanconi anaemia protein FANCD2 [Trinorchestia longiramus]|nr:Fanconi anaemia protein FANCD2 [Trinorchestia longiramus]
MRCCCCGQVLLSPGTPQIRALSLKLLVRAGALVTLMLVVACFVAGHAHITFWLICLPWTCTHLRQVCWMQLVFRELYTSRPGLVPAILDSLLDLSLSDSNIAEVHSNVLKNLHASEPQHLPCVMKFLLSYAQQTTAYQVVSEIREKLHLPKEDSNGAGPSSRRTTPNSEHADIAVLVCSTIRMALLLKKYLVNAWLKAIDDVEYIKVRTEDLLVLVVVHDAVPARRRVVHSVLRNKIRTGLVYDVLLHSALANNSAVKREYFESLKKLAGVMVRSPEPAVAQFGVAIYRTLFETSQGSASLQQEVVVALLAHMGDDRHVRLSSLTLLASLAHRHTAHMARFAIYLKGSLEQLERLSLQESRCLLDAVCAVAASDNTTALHSELAIHTRKMLNSTDIRYKRLGVLSAVLTLKNSFESSATEECGEGSECGGGGEDMLDMVQVCTASCPPASALFMDELSSTILRDGINLKLERWLSGKLEESFENMFVVDLEPASPETATPLMQLPLQLAFDLEVEEQAEIVLNLATLVEKLEQHRQQQKSSKASRAATIADTQNSGAQMQTIILTLAPHLRLLRMLTCHLNNGDLTAIDGLLGCPVYYPHPDVLTSEGFSGLPPDQQSLVLSCLFFAANWFRELINAFVTQKAPELKKKVYARLRNLLEVERTLSTLLPLCPSYRPHVVASHVDPDTTLTLPTPAGCSAAAGSRKKGRKPKSSKKSKPETTVSATQASQAPATLAPSQPSTSQPPATQLPLTQPPQEKLKNCDLSACTPFLRELHLDVFSLLFRTMCLDVDLQSAGNQLSVLEADFLLTDLNLKLAHVFGAAKRSSALDKNTSDKGAGFWHLSLFSAEEVASQTHRFVKPICVHLDNISTLFSSLIADHDGILDCSGVLNERTLPVARVQRQLLTALQLLLTWPQLHAHCNIYTAMLVLVCRKTWPHHSMEEVQALPLQQLVWGAFCYARRQIHALLELGSAVLLVRLLESIVGLAKLLGYESVPEDREQESEEASSSTHLSDESPELRNLYSYKLGEVVTSVLQRNWTTAAEGLPDKGTVYNQRIAVLLQCWLRTSTRSLTAIHHICTTGLEEYTGSSGRDPVSDTFPTLNKGTLGIYVSCLLSNLSPSVKKALAAAELFNLSADLSEEEENRRYFDVWGSAVDVYTKLFRVVKQHHSRHLLSACLKYARPFLELFLHVGMSVMDTCLRSRKDEVCKLFKTLQSATRILQTMCTESKVKKDVTLTSHVPVIRRSLATLVFRVKAMLVRHNCSQAFWLGVLKNRNLDGDIIASQSGEIVEDAKKTEEKTHSAPPDDGEEETESGEGVELEDELSDVELEEETSEYNKSLKGMKRKKPVCESDDEIDVDNDNEETAEEEEEDDEEESETVDDGTDYSASF